MKNKVLFNNSSVDVTDYRIEEAALDENGNIISSIDPIGYKTTGKTLEWTIKAGEKLEFPEYVAKYLMSIFGFLEEYKVEKKLEEEKVKEVEDVKETKEGVFTCKFCGKTFDKKRAFSMHIGATHADELANL